ncbi:MAG: hypothetical protein LIP77_04590, partial [Planctomycetes bacterium]|nr:hypothetical protein [Planctomycetota bacterium]
YVLLSDARHASEDTKVYLSEISGLQKRYEAMAVFHAGDNAGVEQETPAERLEMAYFGFRPAFHAVVRAEVWRTTFARLPAACCNHFFNEIFFHHVLYIMGMRASLRVLFSALLPILHDQPFYNRRRFDPEMLTEAPVVEAEEALAELMAERTGNCMESCRAAVRTGFLEYLRFNPRPTLASHLATCEPEAEASLREVAECFLDAPVVW